MSVELHYTLIDNIKCYNPEEAGDYKDYPDAGFDVTAKLESESFWVASRCRLLKRMIDKYSAQFRPARFLEIGCGTGEFIREAARNKGLKITGSDIYIKGLLYAKKKLPDIEFIQFNAAKGILPEKFDIVGAFDVLEHIDDDLAVISNVKDMLVDGGIFVITVPQYMFMWSSLDDIVRHKRRYSGKELQRKLSKAGFKVKFATSFLFILFPLMALSRIFKRVTARKGQKNEFENYVSFPKFLNRIFDNIMRVDEFLISRGISLPFGGSLVMVAEKPGKPTA